MSTALLGFIFGTFFGGLAMMVCITALIVAREADEREERYWKQYDKDSNRTSTCPDDDIRSTLADSGLGRDRDDDIRTLEG